MSAGGARQRVDRRDDEAFPAEPGEQHRQCAEYAELQIGQRKIAVMRLDVSRSSIPTTILVSVPGNALKA